MFGGTYAQALLDIVIEVADGDAGHGGAPVPGTRWIVIGDCNAINEVDRLRSAKIIWILHSSKSHEANASAGGGDRDSPPCHAVVDFDPAYPFKGGDKERDFRQSKSQQIDVPRWA
jgi:hypothetical protein